MTWAGRGFSTGPSAVPLPKKHGFGFSGNLSSRCRWLLLLLRHSLQKENWQTLWLQLDERKQTRIDLASTFRLKIKENQPNSFSLFLVSKKRPRVANYQVNKIFHPTTPFLSALFTSFPFMPLLHPKHLPL